MDGIKCLFFFFSLAAAQGLYAQQPALPPYQPTHSEEMLLYKQTLLSDSAVKNTVFKTTVRAAWQQGGEKCWYRNILKDSAQEYIYVDVVHGRRQKAFL